MALTSNISTSRVAVVTGAGTGIGRASALALLQDGWHVVLAGRRAAMLDEVRSSDGKAIVWCKYREDIRRVVRALAAEGIRCVEYHGAVHSQAKRQQAGKKSLGVHRIALARVGELSL